MAYNNVLKILRSECRLTQQQVAQVLGIDRSTYAHYENAAIKPPAKAMFKLARLYNVSLDELWDRKNKNPRQGGVKIFADMDDDCGVTIPEYLRNFGSLSADELRLVLLYRASSKKNEILKYVAKKSEEDTEDD